MKVRLNLILTVRIWQGFITNEARKIFNSLPNLSLFPSCSPRLSSLSLSASFYILFRCVLNSHVNSTPSFVYVCILVCIFKKINKNENKRFFCRGREATRHCWSVRFTIIAMHSLERDSKLTFIKIISYSLFFYAFKKILWFFQLQILTILCIKKQHTHEH